MLEVSTGSRLRYYGSRSRRQTDILKGHTRQLLALYMYYYYLEIDVE
jgi:hypothetical protein